MNVIIPTVISAVAAISAAIAAIAAWRGLAVTKNISRAQMVLSLREFYEEPRIKEGKQMLAKWKYDNPNDFAIKFAEKRSQNYQSIKEIDDYRRLIKGYYIKAYDFYKLGVLKKDQLMHFLVSEEQAYFFLEIIVPMQMALNPKDPAFPIYEFYRKIYPCPEDGAWDWLNEIKNSANDNDQ